MAESQLAEFYERVARYERARGLGQGFEADGTLGRSHDSRPSRRNPVRFIVNLTGAVSVLCALKAGIILFVGENIYADRVAEMADGQGIDRLGAAILQNDPLSAFLVHQAHIWGPAIREFLIRI